MRRDAAMELPPPGAGGLSGRGQMLPDNAMPLPSDSFAEQPPSDLGRGPGMAGDRHDPIVENPYRSTRVDPLSTFSIDVDTAAYAKVRSYLLGQSRLPRPDAVRIEELVNYFDYDYAGPGKDTSHPFATHVGLTDCPWQENHKLARIAIKGREFPAEQSGPSNLVFLIDVSGSMKGENRLPLLKQAIGLLADKLGPRDTVSMVVYAGASGVVLDGAAGDDAEAIMGALRRLQAGGSTNGGAGIELAYQLAREHFVEQGSNRVILCSDGDFNVGTTGTDQLVRMVERNARDGVFLTVLGFGMGNHNDAMLEQISGRGNGNYFFIDTLREARKVLVEDLHGTLVTIAKDVKIQIEFNPAKVAAYRLIGYENRVLEAQDFNDDKKDAGEIGAGHRVTALYELVPQGVDPPAEMAPIEPLRYQREERADGGAEEVANDEWLVIRLRYKQPEASQSEKLEFVFDQPAVSWEKADADLRFAAAVASFGMLLRDSQYRGTFSYDDVLQIAEAAVGEDSFGLREEFCELVRAARRLN
jgi:Ca-activated chloride channel family protein